MPIKKKKKEEEKEPEPLPVPPKQEKPGIFTSVETGEPTGLRLPGGKVFLGLTSEEIAEKQKDLGLGELPLISEEEKPRTEQLRELIRPPGEQIPGKEPLTKTFTFTDETGATHEVEVPITSEQARAAGQEEARRDVEFLALGAAATPGAPVAAGGKIVKVGKSAIQISKDALSTKRAQTAISTVSTSAVTKGSLLSQLWATKVGKAILVAGGAQALLDGAISAYDTANSQFKEGVPVIVKGVRNGAFTPSEGMNKIDDMEEDLLRNERTLKLLSIFSVRAKLGKLQSTMNRIVKIKDEIAASRRDILLVASQPTPPNQEQLALMLDELKGGG